MLLKFKEIPQGNVAGGQQDTFELFARDFFVTNGYKIIKEPTHGADGGVDMVIAEEIDTGTGTRDFNWLVSCKHYAHSGKRVGNSDDINIRDRMESNDCEGFIGFYSTLATTALQNTLEGFKGNTPYRLYDSEKIERSMIGFSKFENLMLRYFPASYKNYKALFNYLEPVKLFENYIEYHYKHDKPLIIALFGGLDYFLKNIRNSLDLEDALYLNKTDLITVKDLFDYIPWMKPYNGFKAPNNRNITNYSLQELVNKIIPEEVGFLHGRNIAANALFSNADFVARSNTLLYPNILLVNPTKEVQLNLMFDDLKMMLR